MNLKTHLYFYSFLACRPHLPGAKTKLFGDALQTGEFHKRRFCVLYPVHTNVLNMSKSGLTKQGEKLVKIC